jgi:hypothetical protein
MSEQLDQATKTFREDSETLLTQALFHAEAFRVNRATKDLPDSTIYRVSLDANRRFNLQYLRYNHYLVTLYHSDPPGAQDLHNRRHLGYPESWLLKYDSHHARWKVEAWNRIDGNKGFHRAFQRIPERKTYKGYKFP